MANLDDKNITKLFLKLYPVQVFIVISSSLSSLINGLIIGNNFDATSMTALGFIVPVISIFSAFASIISNGAGVLCGRLMGKGELKKINNVFSTSISLLLAFGILSTLISLLFSKSIVGLCGADDLCLADTISYLQGIAIGLIPLVTIPCLMVFLQMYNQSGFSLIASILLALCNFLLSMANIKLFHGGIFGIGLASSLSQYITLFVIMLFFIKKKLVAFKFNDFDKQLIKPIAIFGFSGALGNILYSLRNATINNLASTSFGSDAVNALAILGSYSPFIDTINIGFANAFGMLASVYIGERDSTSLTILAKRSGLIVEMIDIVRICFFALFGQTFVKLFGAGGNVVSLAADLSIWYSSAHIVNIFAIVFLSSYNALGRIKYTPFLNLITAYVAPISWCLATSKILGVTSIWTCYVAAEFIILLVFAVIMIIKNRKIPKALAEMIWLDKNFEPKHKLSISINTIEEVINVSKCTEDFLKGLNIDAKRSQFAGLCIEEMAGNIVDHGFKKDNKKHAIDIFAYVENDEITIRIKDDCIPFDPNTRNSLYNPQDSCKNVGIRLVAKIAKSMNYQATFGLNVLTIIL